jgi:integrase
MSKREKRAGIVPVTREIQALIDAAIQIQLKKSAKLTYESAVPVFSINANTLDTQWRKATNSAGCVDLHFHDLRHEGTSRLFERGLNIAEVMTITGHSTKEMVDRYSHYSAALILEKLEKEIKPEDIAADFLMLIENFGHRGGDIKRLQRMIINSFAAVASK